MTESLPPPKDTLDKHVECLFNFVDRNNNGKLDISELFCGLMLLLGGHRDDNDSEE